MREQSISSGGQIGKSGRIHWSVNEFFAEEGGSPVLLHLRVDLTKRIMSLNAK